MYTMNFCVLLLYPGTLLSLLTLNFLAGLFRIFYLYFYYINMLMSSVKRDTFTSSFSSLLIALAGTVSSFLNSSSKSRYPCCWFPDVRGKAFSLLPLCMMLAVGFHKLFYNVLKVFFYFKFIDCFLK